MAYWIRNDCVLCVAMIRSRAREPGLLWTHRHIWFHSYIFFFHGKRLINTSDLKPRNHGTVEPWASTEHTFGFYEFRGGLLPILLPRAPNTVHRIWIRHIPHTFVAHGKSTFVQRKYRSGHHSPQQIVIRAFTTYTTTYSLPCLLPDLVCCVCVCVCPLRTIFVHIWFVGRLIFGRW